MRGLFRIYHACGGCCDVLSEWSRRQRTERPADAAMRRVEALRWTGQTGADPGGTKRCASARTIFDGAFTAGPRPASGYAVAVREKLDRRLARRTVRTGQFGRQASRRSRTPAVGAHQSWTDTRESMPSPPLGPEHEAHPSLRLALTRNNGRGPSGVGAPRCLKAAASTCVPLPGSGRAKLDARRLEGTPQHGGRPPRALVRWRPRVG